MLSLSTGMKAHNVNCELPVSRAYRDAPRRGLFCPPPGISRQTTAQIQAQIGTPQPPEAMAPIAIFLCCPEGHEHTGKIFEVAGDRISGDDISRPPTGWPSSSRAGGAKRTSLARSPGASDLGQREETSRWRHNTGRTGRLCWALRAGFGAANVLELARHRAEHFWGPSRHQGHAAQRPRGPGRSPGHGPRCAVLQQQRGRSWQAPSYPGPDGPPCSGRRGHPRSPAFPGIRHPETLRGRGSRRPGQSKADGHDPGRHVA